MREPPLGQKVHAALVRHGAEGAAAVARAAGQPDLFDRVNAVATEEPVPSFLHSALCAMSLPVRRPADDAAPILRQDGQYTLAITPKPVLVGDGGQQRLVSLGVPYGSLPRLILIHVMSQAVRGRTRQIRLGETFTDWMRRMGYRTISYGPRGSATLIRQQLDRLLACEWMIRWQGEDEHGGREFGIKEMKLTTEYVGSDRPGGAFMREIILTEAFYDHLKDHAVPLNENAIWQLRDSPTALDLYTWLAYRLPRIASRRAVVLSWPQLASHFGNEGSNIRKFRQTIRDAWERQVSAVYPEARIDFDSSLVRLHPSPAPLQQTVVRLPSLRVIAGEGARSDPPAAAAVPEEPPAARFLEKLRQLVGAVQARTWLRDAAMEDHPDGPRLVLGSRFLADWVRTNFDQQLHAAARAVGLPAAPTIAARGG
ncbi:MAG TPA: replication protein RepA [Crenalkalicoccus sp.]|nr:replication protein RepA [Crenalkalicoccus sp.]